MLMAMSNAEKWLNHTKSGHFFQKKNGHRTPSWLFLKMVVVARALDICKKSQAFRLKHYGRPVFLCIDNFTLTICPGILHYVNNFVHFWCYILSLCD